MVNKMRRFEKQIKCPYYKNISKQSIICESITERVVRSPMVFKNNAEMYSYMNDFCKSGCWRGCPLAEMIEKKYL